MSKRLGFAFQTGSAAEQLKGSVSHGFFKAMLTLLLYNTAIGGITPKQKLVMVA